MPRGRPPAIRRSTPLEVSLDEELRALLDIKLWSTVEQRVPQGAYKAFFDRLLAQELKGAALDLAPFTGAEPGKQVVRGSVADINELRRILETP